MAMFAYVMVFFTQVFADTKENFSYTCLERLTHKKSSNKFVALTFDDGPSRSITPKILKILNEKGVKATFFVLGRNVKNNPEIVRSLRDSGHEIANHSYSHANLRKRSSTSIEDELQKTNAELAKLEILPGWFRPPYGSSNSTVKNKAFAQNMHTIFWSLDSKDWKRPNPETLKQRVLDRTQPGEVILLHDIHRNTLKALPGIIDGLQTRGYTFVTISEWYDRLKNITPTRQLLCSK
ncbi:MAG: polysaccharide deacetylase family protein [Pseudomonadota bacterium]